MWHAVRTGAILFPDAQLDPVSARTAYIEPYWRPQAKIYCNTLSLEHPMGTNRRLPSCCMLTVRPFRMGPAFALGWPPIPTCGSTICYSILSYLTLLSMQGHGADREALYVGRSYPPVISSSDGITRQLVQQNPDVQWQ